MLKYFPGAEREPRAAAPGRAVLLFSLPGISSHPCGCSGSRSCSSALLCPAGAVAGNRLCSPLLSPRCALSCTELLGFCAVGASGLWGKTELLGWFLPTVKTALKENFKTCTSSKCQLLLCVCVLVPHLSQASLGKKQWKAPERAFLKYFPWLISVYWHCSLWLNDCFLPSKS